MSPEFLHRFVFQQGKTTACKTTSKEMIRKHNIQGTHINSFHNRSLREVTVILELLNQKSAGADVVMRTKVTLPKNFGMKATIQKI